MGEIRKEKIHDYEPLFGSWKIVRKLGEGGFGKVYEVSYDNQRAVVKLIEPLDERKLIDMKKEIRFMLKTKNEPNIVSIYDFAEVEHKDNTGKDLLILMELLNPLNRIIEQRKLTVGEVIKIGIHICRALEVCDKYGIIHRDIKPANILVTENFAYKLSDFGVSRVFSGVMIEQAGTPEFWAPEVSGQTYDKRADIYSLGVTMYFLLNGNKLPPLNEKDGELFPTINGISNNLLRVISKACALKQDNRFSDATQFRVALEQVLKTMSASTEKSTVGSNDITLKNSSFSSATAKQSTTTAATTKNLPDVAMNVPEEPIAVREIKDMQAQTEFEKGRDYFNEKNLTHLKRDYAKAEIHLKNAATRGHVEAQCMLGEVYSYSDNPGKDFVKAAGWYSKAAATGHERAQWLLGSAYFGGLGVAKDVNKAKYWLTKSAAQNYREAQYGLGSCYMMENNYIESKKWMMKAASQNHPDAMEALEILRVMIESGYKG